VKRIFVLVLVAIVCLTSALPAAARVDERLTAAVQLAKQFFPETDNFRNFRSSLDTRGDRAVFSLHWSGANTDPAGHNPSSLWVSVDISRRLVVSFRHEPSTPRTTPPSLTAIPQFDRAHAERVAREFAQRLAPTQFDTMRLHHVDEPAIRIGRRHWPHFYTLGYIQYVNGIPFAPNSVRIAVNADTGAVQVYDLAWEDYTFPPATGVISQAELERVFGKVGLKLVYQRVQWWRPMQDNESEPFLAFVLEDGSSLAIDAFTGKVTRIGWHGAFPPRAIVEGMAQQDARQGLAPAELKEIDFVAGLLPLERAEIIAREITALPPTVPMTGSQLYAQGDGEVRLWQLHFSQHDRDVQVWAQVTLDAKTGALISFHYSDDEKAEPKPSLTAAQAQQLAQAFLQKWAADKFQNVRLEVSGSGGVEPRPDGDMELPHSYWFTFRRYVNNIPVATDQLGVTVRHDRRVTSFHSNWYEGKFPSPAGALTPAQMTALFLREHGLHLEYVLDHQADDVTAEAKASSPMPMPMPMPIPRPEPVPGPAVRLVFRPRALPSYSFDAFTGKNIDHTGEEIKPVVKPVYTDIAGHWAERDIAQLVGLGLLRLPGPAFKPDAVITVGEFLRVLADASGMSGDFTTMTRSFAVQSGILEQPEAEKVDLNLPLTRELMAYYLARQQGHGQTAALRGIWATPFRDFAQVAPEYQGSVAVVHALGLMAGDTAGNFLPQQQTTRAQAIVIIGRMLHMK
jgi:hypothetical protein